MACLVCVAATFTQAKMTNSDTNQLRRVVIIGLSPEVEIAPENVARFAL
jgi:hypothetical protein